MSKKSNKPIDDVVLLDMANFLSIFGDYNRLRILNCISYEEFTVSELCEKLNMSKSAISHQLKTLKDNRLLKMRKSGKNKFFSLDDGHVLFILNATKEHIEEGVNHERIH